jgi:predicted small metal-binding protein
VNASAARHREAAPCGFVVKGENDDQIVSNAQKHAKEVHQMELTREQALSMAKPS